LSRFGGSRICRFFASSRAVFATQSLAMVTPDWTHATGDRRMCARTSGACERFRDSRMSARRLIDMSTATDYLLPSEGTEIRPDSFPFARGSKRENENLPTTSAALNHFYATYEAERRARQICRAWRTVPKGVERCGTNSWNLAERRQRAGYTGLCSSKARAASRNWLAEVLTRGRERRADPPRFRLAAVTGTDAQRPLGGNKERGCWSRELAREFCVRYGECRGMIGSERIQGHPLIGGTPWTTKVYARRIYRHGGETGNSTKQRLTVAGRPGPSQSRVHANTATCRGRVLNERPSREEQSVLLLGKPFRKRRVKKEVSGTVPASEKAGIVAYVSAPRMDKHANACLHLKGGFWKLAWPVRRGAFKPAMSSR